MPKILISKTFSFFLLNLEFAIDKWHNISGVDPDVYILAINFFDEMEYIRRTVNYLNSLGEGIVIAFVLSPFSIKETVTGIKMQISENTKQQVIQKKKELMDYFSIPVFDFPEIEELGNTIIDYFGE